MVWVSGAIRTLSPDRFPSPITYAWRRTPPSNPRNASPHFRVHNEVPLGAPILSHLRSENRLTESTGCPTGKRSATWVARDSGSSPRNGRSGPSEWRENRTRKSGETQAGVAIAGRKLELRARAISRTSEPSTAPAGSKGQPQPAACAQGTLTAGAATSEKEKRRGAVIWKGCALGQKKLSRGASLRGQGTPADPARLRSVRARNPEKFFKPQPDAPSPATGWRIVRGGLGELRPHIGVKSICPRRRGGIHTARSRQPRPRRLHRAVRYAARARGSGRAPDRPW